MNTLLIQQSGSSPYVCVHVSKQKVDLYAELHVSNRLVARRSRRERGAAELWLRLALTLLCKLCSMCMEMIIFPIFLVLHLSVPSFFLMLPVLQKCTFLHFPLFGQYWIMLLGDKGTCQQLAYSHCTKVGHRSETWTLSIIIPTATP